MKNPFKILLEKWRNRHKHNWRIISSRKYYGILGNASGHYKLKEFVMCIGCGISENRTSKRIKP